MSDAMKQREQQLNSQVPGMSGTSGVPTKSDQLYEARKEVHDLAVIATQYPNDMRTRQKLINKAREVGHLREEMKNK